MCTSVCCMLLSNCCIYRNCTAARVNLCASSVHTVPAVCAKIYSREIQQLFYICCTASVHTVPAVCTANIQQKDNSSYISSVHTVPAVYTAYIQQGNIAAPVHLLYISSIYSTCVMYSKRTPSDF